MGILIFSNKDMGEIKFPSVGGRIWEDLIEDHIQHGALRQVAGTHHTRHNIISRKTGDFWPLLEIGGVTGF